MYMRAGNIVIRSSNILCKRRCGSVMMKPFSSSSSKVCSSTGFSIDEVYHLWYGCIVASDNTGVRLDSMAVSSKIVSTVELERVLNSESKFVDVVIIDSE